jgi:putative endonuclease
MAVMKFYYVYILRCSDDSLYVGVTSDVERRVMEHNSGKYPEAYTYSRKPVELVFYQEFTEPNQAIEFEKKIKKWSRMKKQALINDNFDKIQELSECRNATHFKYNPDNKDEID